MNETFSDNLKQLIDKAKTNYVMIFNESPTHCAYAPGRVNLIGEHIDYNDGFVLPMAIPLYTVIVGAPKKDGKEVKIVSLSMKENVTIINLKETISPVNSSWSNYVRGVIAYFKDELMPFNAVIASDLPLGAGLSSSASLEVAVYTFLEAVSPATSSVTLKDKALLCQKAEHDFAKVPCGIMDQFIVTMAQLNNALLIDCRSYQSEQIPLRGVDSDVAVLIIDSGVKHELASSEYSERKDTCMKAAATLELKSFRDLSLAQFTVDQSKLDVVSRRRVHHVISEIERTQEAAELLKSQNYRKFGELMSASHKSLRDDYEVSCYALDELVELANQCKGVYGSRMTGGGFGGCTVTLLKKDVIPAVLEHVTKNYSSGTVNHYVTEPVAGASRFAF